MMAIVAPLQLHRCRTAGPDRAEVVRLEGRARPCVGTPNLATGVLTGGFCLARGSRQVRQRRVRSSTLRIWRSLRDWFKGEEEASESPAGAPRISLGAAALLEHKELEAIQTDGLKRWAIVGAGPVGLTLALQVASLMERYGWSPREASITVYETRISRETDTRQWKRKGRRRGQVVTLQDAVVDIFKSQHRDLHDAFDGERVWPRSRNCAILDLEDRLLVQAQAREGPGRYIRLRRCPPAGTGGGHMQWLHYLAADIVVAADGAASATRESLRWPRTALGATAPERLVDCDYALGVGLLDDLRVPQPQSLNVVLTLSQNRYMLNSEQGMRGYLNIRITKEEYEHLFAATGQQGCGFGTPIGVFNPLRPPPEGVTMLPERQEWLEATIRDGLTLYGLTEYHVQEVVGIQLRPAYVTDFFGVVMASHGKPVPLLLVGDAAISHHFWPGRGLNSGLKAAAAVAFMWSGGGASDPQWNSVAAALSLFQSFMTALRVREMQGRSQSLLLKENQLPEWIPEMLDQADGGRARGCDAERAENEAALLQSAKAWRDFLERQGKSWPHREALTDEMLSDAICRRRARPGPVSAAIMRESARPVRLSGLSGWPIHQQAGREVDPRDLEQWGWSRSDSRYSEEALAATRRGLGAALEADPQDDGAWCSLGAVGGGEVGGVAYTEKHCYQTALEINPTNSKAWSHLGAIGGGEVASVEYGEKQCYQMALGINPKDSKAWYHLGVAGGGQVAAVQYTDKQCYQAALELDPQDALTWHALGVAGGGEVDGVDYTAKLCCQLSLELDPNGSEAWRNLGDLGGGNVAAVEYTRKQCYKTARRLDKAVRKGRKP